jgi:predicted amidohydrolase YtcJ
MSGRRQLNDNGRFFSGGFIAPVVKANWIDPDPDASDRLSTNAEMLTAWCSTTPQAIFPARRLGRLQPGYEANFVVLGGNPLADFNAVKDVREVYKRGESLPLPAAK